MLPSMQPFERSRTKRARSTKSFEVLRVGPLSLYFSHFELIGFNLDGLLDGHGHNPFFSGKSVVIDAAVGGDVSAPIDNVLLFTGINEKLIPIVVSQKFDDLRNYSYDSGTSSTTLRCVVPKGRFENDFRPTIRIPNVSFSGGYAIFNISGQVHYTKSGLVVGVFPVPKAWRSN